MIVWIVKVAMLLLSMCFAGVAVWLHEDKFRVESDLMLFFGFCFGILALLLK